MHYFLQIPEFIFWWYTKGILRAFDFLGALFNYLTNFFSIKNTLVTFFAPWRRLVVERRPGLDGFRDWLLDNLISRSVGIVMRIMVVFGFLITFIAYILFAVFALLTWIFFPVLLVVSFGWIFVGGRA